MSATMPAPLWTDPAYAKRDDCPSWCEHHNWDHIPGPEPTFTGHAGGVGPLEDWIDLSLHVDGRLTGSPYAADYDRTPNELREFAARLIEAADVLERG